MSFNAVEQAFEVPIRDSGAKLVLLVLARHVNNDGQCWPSMKRISKLTGMSISSIKRKIRLLEESGLVRHRRRRKQDGEPDSNLYEMGVWLNLTLPMAQAEPLISHRNSNSISSSLMAQFDPYLKEEEEIKF